MRAALFPFCVPPLNVRLSDWKLPLKTEPPAICTAPAPVKREPLLKTLLALLKTIVPVWASIRPPSLTKRQLPTLVTLPADLEKLPVLTNSACAPKFQVRELASDSERHSPRLFTTAPLPPCTGSANHRTRLRLVKVVPTKRLVPPELISRISSAVSGSGAVMPVTKSPLDQVKVIAPASVGASVMATAAASSGYASVWCRPSIEILPVIRLCGPHQTGSATPDCRHCPPFAPDCMPVARSRRRRRPWL